MILQTKLSFLDLLSQYYFFLSCILLFHIFVDFFRTHVPLGDRVATLLILCNYAVVST